MSPFFGVSVLNELQVPFSDIESQTVHVGKEEAVHLLVTSFLRCAVHLLVTSFLFRDSASLGSQGQRTMTPARSSNIWKMMMLSFLQTGIDRTRK
ncbi:hypothetical protein PS2_006098 [Malus domestica]